MGKIPTRIPNYSSGGTPTKHAEANAVFKGTVASYSSYRNSLPAGTNIVSCTITTTKKSLIVVVASFLSNSNYSYPDIKRGGVTKTQNRQVTSEDGNLTAFVVLWAWELLDAGTYQYDLVTSVVTMNIYGASIKAIAVDVE